LGKHLHIVSFDVPFAANYGGIIDVFYQLKALHSMGISITMHCFAYGPDAKRTALEKYCTTVNYYPRSNYWRYLFSKTPFIIASRSHADLLKNLCVDDSPILFEAIHSTSFVHHPLLQHRTKVVRTLNVESDYYQQLAENENNFFKKIYYKTEAKRLLHYENTQLHNTKIACIAKHDVDYFSNLYGKQYCHYVGPFHGFDTVNILPTTGNYSLYHGNLSVAENETSALWLIQEVFSKIPTKLIIAGSNPSENLFKMATASNIELIANPTDVQLQTLIQQAQINVLPSFQNTGLKLKLMNALYNGKHCLVNPIMLTGTALQDVCTIATTSTEWHQTILQLMEKPFNTLQIENRKNKLEAEFSVSKHARVLNDLLFAKL
jgi:hypothetical protein